jgi:hypothetical protein
MKTKLRLVFPVLIALFVINITLMACGTGNEDGSSGIEQLLSDARSLAYELSEMPSFEEYDYVEPPIPIPTVDEVRTIFFEQKGSEEYGYWADRVIVENIGESGEVYINNLFLDDWGEIKNLRMQDISFERTSNEFPYKYSGTIELAWENGRYNFQHNQYNYYETTKATTCLVECTYDGISFKFEFHPEGISSTNRNYSFWSNTDNALYYNNSAVKERKNQASREKEKAINEWQTARSKAQARLEVLSLASQNKLNAFTINGTDLVHVKFPKEAEKYVLKIASDIDSEYYPSGTSKVIAKNIYIPFDNYIRTHNAIVAAYSSNSDESLDGLDKTFLSYFSSYGVGLNLVSSMLTFRSFDFNQFSESIYPLNKKNSEEIFTADMSMGILTEFLLQTTEAAYRRLSSTNATERTRELRRVSANIDKENIALFKAIYPDLARDKNITVKGFLSE